MAPLLELHGVSKSFGGLRVIQGLDLTVEEGEIVSLIGPNGAGKTTVFNLVTGVYAPYKGTTRLDGANEVLPQPDVLHAISMPHARRCQACHVDQAQTATTTMMQRVPTWT